MFPDRMNGITYVRFEHLGFSVASLSTKQRKMIGLYHDALEYD